MVMVHGTSVWWCRCVALLQVCGAAGVWHYDKCVAAQMCGVVGAELLQTYVEGAGV